MAVTIEAMLATTRALPAILAAAVQRRLDQEMSLSTQPTAFSDRVGAIVELWHGASSARWYLAAPAAHVPPTEASI
jgi:hypothetical protein